MSQAIPNPQNDPEDAITIIELEERLEFGAVILDSDLGADANSGCANGSCPGSVNSSTSCHNSTC